MKTPEDWLEKNGYVAHGDRWYPSDAKIVRESVEVDGTNTGWVIFCPACKCGHKFVKGRWSFNGDMARPTFSPSMLVGGCLNHERETYGTCHSYVTDGQIQFLPDCTHELAGKTVRLEPF